MTRARKVWRVFKKTAIVLGVTLAAIVASVVALFIHQVKTNERFARVTQSLAYLLVGFFALTLIAPPIADVLVEGVRGTFSNIFAKWTLLVIFLVFLILFIRWISQADPRKE